MSDIVEAAEQDEASWHPAIGYPSGLVAELVAELKAARAQLEQAQEPLKAQLDAAYKQGIR